MAKIGLTKLGLSKVQDIKTFEFNEQIIEVKQYLPIQEKLELISRVINQSTEESKFYNPGKLSVFFKLEIAYTYTNINFTDKQKEEFCKTFDLLESTGLFGVILDNLPQSELEVLLDWTLESVKSIYEYNNSARAILESLQTNYNNLDFDVTSLQDKIRDPETLSLLKEIAPLLDLA